MFHIKNIYFYFCVFCFASTNNLAGNPVSLKPDIWPDIRPDTGYQKRPDIQPNIQPDIRLAGYPVQPYYTDGQICLSRVKIDRLHIVKEILKMSSFQKRRLYCIALIIINIISKKGL